MKSRPFVHQRYESVDVRMDAFDYFLNNYKVSMDMEKILCKTSLKDFLTRLYALVGTRQACMARLVRDSKHSLLGSGRAHTPRVMLKGACRRARDLAAANDHGPPGGPDVQVRRPGSEAPAIAGERGWPGSKSGTTLRNAVPRMFALVRRPRMEPANNLAERMIRPVAVVCAVRSKVITAGGMRCPAR